MIPHPLRTRRAPHHIVATLVAAATLAGTAPLGAQPALLDSLRPQVESAVVRSDWPALMPIIARLRTAARGPGARDPWTHYDLAYVLHRHASAMLIAGSIESAKPLLEEAEREAATAAELGGGAQALGLRGALTGQLAGASGMLAAMRMGPRSFKQLDEALKGAPNDPRVALLNGMTRLNAPAAFGGGPAKAEPELRRAIALFAQDRPAGGQPRWGRADAHIWLAIALQKQGKIPEARTELDRALAVSPGHVWVTRELLPKLGTAR